MVEQEYEYRIDDDIEIIWLTAWLIRSHHIGQLDWSS
jgi:hypothetical protein